MSIDTAWDAAIPTLQDYIAIPARSPMFDAEWERSGHIAGAAALLAAWAGQRSISGMTIEVISPPGLTPVLLIEIAASTPDLAERTVVIYGHMDKQPELLPWSDGLGPWTPVIRGDRLYGRGGADDGYSVFSALIAIEQVQADGGDHARLVVMIESSEESSSVHLAEHLVTLMPRIGPAELVITLDSFCETYDRLWTTTSTRGVAGGVLDIRVCLDDPHSGRASGVLPSAFRILRQLLDRIEDRATGAVLLGSANVEIAPGRLAEADIAAAAFPSLASSFHPLPGVVPMAVDPAQQLLNETWRPALEVIGMDGIPNVAAGGNVFRSHLAVKLSIRIPPTSVVGDVARELRETITKDPPSGATVDFTIGAQGPGWAAPEMQPWLSAAAERASLTHFGQRSAACGVGGTIPFMGMLGKQLPDAQFLLIGVLGPGSNAHGPDEFLHLPTVRRVTRCVADVIRAHAASPRPDGRSR